MPETKAKETTFALVLAAMTSLLPQKMSYLKKRQNRGAVSRLQVFFIPLTLSWSGAVVKEK